MSKSGEAFEKLTYEEIRSMALKEAGDALVKFMTRLNIPVMHGDYQFDIIETNKFIEALKRGEMPE